MLERVKLAWSLMLNAARCVAAVASDPVIARGMLLEL